MPDFIFAMLLIVGLSGGIFMTGQLREDWTDCCLIANLSVLNTAVLATRDKINAKWTRWVSRGAVMGKSTKSSNPPDFFYADKTDLPASDAPTTSQKMTRKTKQGKFDPEQQAVIGRHLQALYDEVVSQALPEKLKALLGTLDQLPKKNG